MYSPTLPDNLAALPINLLTREIVTTNPITKETTTSITVGYRAVVNGVMIEQPCGSAASIPEADALLGDVVFPELRTLFGLEEPKHKGKKAQD